MSAYRTAAPPDETPHETRRERREHMRRRRERELELLEEKLQLLFLAKEVQES